ncbi:MAG: hypothetical protein O3A10_09750 [Chloroflexi bacterium]|nr:hypothetical protein [Chloroflexota bacterium]
MSGGVIFNIGADGRLQELEETPFDAEATFQELLAEHPRLLAGDQIDPSSPRRWLLVAREVGVPDSDGSGDRWSLDNLFLDQDAIPTFVEVKRSTDTRIRREIVGQMLDYAANALAYWPGERLEAEFRRGRESQGRDPDADLLDFLENGFAPAEFWETARVNLEIGRVRLLFVADRVPAELRRIVEFLNQQMERAEVLAVQIQQFAGGDIQTLVPRVIGVSERQRPRSAAVPRRDQPWDRESFLNRLEELGSADADDTVVVLDWGAAHGLAVSGGRGNRMAGVSLTLGSDPIVGLDEWAGNCRVRVDFRRLPAPFQGGDAREELRQRLNALTVVSLPPETQYQGVSLADLRDANELGRMIEVFDWMLGRIQAAS